MSVIVDFLVIADLPSPHVLEEVNSKLYELDEERHQQFRPLDTDRAGGTKVLCTDVWAGAFNHLEPEKIREAILSANWSEPYAPEEEADVIVVESSGDYEIDLRTRTLAQLREAVSS